MTTNEARRARRPRWEASKDSGLTLDQITEAGHRRETTVETAGPAIIFVLELDADPRIVTTQMTRREEDAWLAHREHSVGIQILCEAMAEVESLSEETTP